VPFYPAVPSAVSSIADAPGRVVAVRVPDLAAPSAGRDSALVVAGTEAIRTGDDVAFLKVVAVAPARVRRDGRVQAAGSPCNHATLGPMEDWLEAAAGPGVIDGVAKRAVLDARLVKGERERLLAKAFMIRAIVLMTLMPGAGVRDAVVALGTGAARWALGRWRNCRPSCCARRMRSTRHGTGGPSRSAGTGR
jgi:hypothetical protein